jgi:DNA-directed RNA polymerase
VVAEAAKRLLPESVHHLLTRKVTKRTVMCVPYGVTINSARQYVRQELPKELPDGVSLMEVVKAIYQQAIPSCIPGPIKAMQFIQKAAVQAVKASGGTHISWVTPSGFHVLQNLTKFKMNRIRSHLMGSTITTALQEPTDEPDLRHHRGAAAPNLIHSLDSALLHLTFEEEKRPFTLIHDCILMRSCDMDDISLRLREEFVKLYSRPVLREWSEQLGVPFDESVVIGDLDIQESLNAPYLFC